MSSDRTGASVTIRGLFNEAVPLEGHPVVGHAHLTHDGVLVVDMPLETGYAQVLLEISDLSWLDQLESAIQVARAELRMAQQDRSGVAA